MPDEGFLLANIDAVLVLQLQQAARGPCHCPGVRCKKKKNSEIKDKSNSVHWAQRAQLLCRKF